MSQKKSFRRTHLGNHRLDPTTQMTAYGYDSRFSEGAVKPPVFLTSTFAFQSAEEGAEFFDIVAGRKPAPQHGGAGGLVYSRFNNPNVEIVEDRLALLDDAESALVTSSGMSAISSIFLTLTRPGDTIVHYTPLYGGTETLLAKIFSSWGVQPAPFMDGLSEPALREALEQARKKGPVRIVYLETPANPTNAMTDLAMVKKVVDDWGEQNGHYPIIVCDNTMLGPVFQKPLHFGVDICVYSLTKYIGGHSDLIGGGLTGSKELLQRIRLTRGAFGFQLDPHSCWMLSRSLETLSLRMERAAKSGSEVAGWLANNSLLPCKVLHPEFLENEAAIELYRNQCTGPGSTFSFIIENNRRLTFRILNELQIFKLAVSLGGTESLVCHPASTTHSGVPQEVRQKVGVTEGLVRLSVGLEHPQDLIEDLRNALTKATKP